MPFKSEKQRKWMHANEPEMAKKWEKKKKSESFNFLKKGIKAFVSEKMNPEQYHRYMQYVFDTQFNTPEEKKMKKSIIKKINKAQKKKGLPVFKESVNEAERDYKDEYKKFQSSTKAKKYRAELNKYNRKKGTYGNGDGKDASHKGGKIVGFESESKNRGRAEKSRLKKEDILNENPGAMAAAAMATVKMKNAQGKQIKGTTALQSSDPSVKKKAKSIFQRLKDKFSKKKGKKDFEKQKKKVAKGADAWVKKQSKSDADFYKRQFAGEEKLREYIKQEIKSVRGESIDESSKIIKSIENLANKNKYGTVTGTRMNGKTAKEIIAIYNHPKMKSQRGKMETMKSHELADLTIKLPKILGIKVESVNEAINHPKVQKQANQLAKVLKNVVAAAKKDDRKLARKLVGNIYDIYNDLDWTIQRDLRYKESVKEALHPYKDFEQQDREKEYDLNLGSFIKRYQMMLKFMKKYKEVPDKNKRPWAAAIRKKLGQSRFNGMIGDFELMQMYLKDFDKFRNIKDKYAFDIKGESVNEDNIKFSKEEMAQLHKDGKIEKDGHTYVYKEDIVNEAASWGYVKTFLIGIIRKKQAKKMDGYLVDMQTANVILKVGNALNKSNQEKFGKLPIKKMAQIAWKMVK